MDVILLQDVKTLGKKGQKVKVNDGYARNFILPKKLGIEATAKNLNDLKLQKANEEKLQQELLEEAQRFAKELEGKIVTVKIKAGQGGRTFGSVSSKEIVQAAKEQLGFELDKKKMQMPVEMKALGNYQIKIKIHPKVVGELTVKVIEK